MAAWLRTTSWWPAEEGADFALSPTLEPLGVGLRRFILRAAKAFVAKIMSPAGQATLRAAGFNLPVRHVANSAAMVLRAVAGIGLIGGSMGCVALLLLALNGAVKMLGSYARLHYRLLKPEQHPA